MSQVELFDLLLESIIIVTNLKPLRFMQVICICYEYLINRITYEEKHFDCVQISKSKQNWRA